METPLFYKSVEIKKAKEKLLRHVGPNVSSAEPSTTSPPLDHSTWRLQPMKNLTSDGIYPNEFNTSDLPIDKPTLNSKDPDDDDDSDSDDYANASNLSNTSCLGLFKNI